MNTTLQVRIYKKTKQNVKKILDDLGLDISSAVKLYFRQIQQAQGLPFRVLTTNGYTPEFEQEILDQSNELLRQRKRGTLKTYSSSRQLFKELDI